MRARNCTLLGILLGVFAAPAMAQGLGFGLNVQDVTGRAGPSSGVVGIVAGAPVAAYSFRKVVPTYNGPAVEIRRGNTDWAVMDVGFLPNGDFDTATAVAYCAAVGGTRCEVTKWYGQTPGSQPMVSELGYVPMFVPSCTPSGKPCMRSEGLYQQLVNTGITWAGIPGAWNVVGVRLSGTAACWLASKSHNLLSIEPTLNTWSMGDQVSNTLFMPGPVEGVWHVGMAWLSGGQGFGRVDTTEYGPTGMTGYAGAGPVRALQVSTGAVCDETEQFVWDGYVPTLAERIALGANQKSYWGF